MKRNGFLKGMAYVLSVAMLTTSVQMPVYAQEESEAEIAVQEYDAQETGGAEEEAVSAGTESEVQSQTEAEQTDAQELTEPEAVFDEGAQEEEATAGDEAEIGSASEEDAQGNAGTTVTRIDGERIDFDKQLIQSNEVVELEEGANYYLNQNITLQEQLVIDKNIRLDLNGNTLRAKNGEFTVIQVESGYTLELYNSKTTGGITDGGIGNFDVNAGDVSDYTEYPGGGVYVLGSLIMYGGSIYGNKADLEIEEGYLEADGGGVYVAGGGAFIMYGGSILNNEATNGGGIFSEGGTVTVYGGTIQKNTANSGCGGGIYGDGISIYGGEIKENTAKCEDPANPSDDGEGGGIYAYSDTLLLAGGTIKDNQAEAVGGGVAGEAEITLTGSETPLKITGNKVGTAPSNLFLDIDSGVVLSVDGPLNNESVIGIDHYSASETPPDIESVSFTDGWSEQNTDSVMAMWSTDPAIFTLDDASADLDAVVTMETTKAELAFGVPVCRIERDSIVTPFDSLAAAFTLAEDGDTITLVEDVELEETILLSSEAEKELYLDLNGHALTSFGQSVFSLGSGSILNIKDSLGKDGTEPVYYAWFDSTGDPHVAKEDGSGELDSVEIYGGYISSDGAPAIYVGEGAEFYLLDGAAIAGCSCTDSNGAAVSIEEGGFAGIYSGSLIAVNHGAMGGGIYVGANGECDIADADLFMNSAQDGGAVYVSEGAELSLEHTDGSESGWISCSTADNYGGAIYAAGNVIIKGYGITENTATDGGAISVSETGAVEVDEASIEYNRATAGGAVRIYDGGSFTFKDGTITDNTALEEGGAIYVYGNGLTLAGGTISDNVAYTHGAGIYVDGSMSVGSGNSITVYGNIMPDGLSGDKAENIYLSGDSRIKIDGALDGSGKIGISLDEDVEDPKVVFFTTGWGENAGTTPASVFVSDFNDWKACPSTSDPVELHFMPLSLYRIHDGEQIAYDTLENALAEAESGDTIRLGDDVVVESTVSIADGLKVTLDLNGCNVAMDPETTNPGAVFEVEGTLILTDGKTVKRRYTQTDDGLVEDKTDGDIVLDSGIVTGGEYGVYVKTDGEFVMNSGGIAGNTGSGVYVEDGGEFNMSGGYIAYNASIESGGGIWADGECDLSGGMIYENDTEGHGGGIYLASNAIMTMDRVTVSANSAGEGGGIYMFAGSSLTLKDVLIENNHAGTHGGGIYCDSYDNDGESYGLYLGEGAKDSFIRITGNTDTDGESNVLLVAGCVAVIDGELIVSDTESESSLVGITVGEVNGADYAPYDIPFTSGWDDGYSSDAFYADDPYDNLYHMIYINEDGELCFGVPLITVTDSDNETTAFASLYEAFDNLTDGCTVTINSELLGADSELKVVSTLELSEAKEVDLDLSGAVLKPGDGLAEKAPIIKVSASGASLTVYGGTIDRAAGDDSLLADVTNGTLYLSYGTYLGRIQSTGKGLAVLGDPEADEDEFGLYVSNPYTYMGENRVISATATSANYEIIAGYYGQEYGDGKDGTIKACVNTDLYGNEPGATVGEEVYPTHISPDYVAVTSAVLKAERDGEEGPEEVSVNDIRIGDTLSVEISPENAFVGVDSGVTDISYQWYRYYLVEGVEAADPVYIPNAIEETYEITADDIQAGTTAIFVKVTQATDQEVISEVSSGKSGAPTKLPAPEEEGFEIEIADDHLADAVLADAQIDVSSWADYEYVIKPASAGAPTATDWAGSQAGDGNLLTLTGLNAGTDYKVYARFAETDEYYAGDVYSVTVTTGLSDVKAWVNGTQIFDSVSVNILDKIRIAPDPAVTGVTYEWYLGEDIIEGAESDSFDVGFAHADAYLTAYIVKNGHRIGKADIGQVGSPDYTIVKTPAQAVVGETVSASVVPVYKKGTTSFEWYLGTQKIAGETGSTLKVKLDMKGKRLIVKVIGTDDLTHTSGQIAEADFGVVTGPDIDTGTVSANTGATVSITISGSAEGVTFVWYKDGVVITGANASQLPITYDMEGGRITVQAIKDGEVIAEADLGNVPVAVHTLRVVAKTMGLDGLYGAEESLFEGDITDTNLAAWTAANQAKAGFTASGSDVRDNKTGDLKRTISYARNKYNLVFDGNGGTINGAKTYVVRDVFYDSIIGDLPEAARDGYELIGWNTGSDGDGDEITATSAADFEAEDGANIRIYALWKEEKGGGGEIVIPDEPTLKEQAEKARADGRGAIADDFPMTAIGTKGATLDVTGVSGNTVSVNFTIAKGSKITINGYNKKVAKNYKTANAASKKFVSVSGKGVLKGKKPIQNAKYTVELDGGKKVEMTITVVEPIIANSTLSANSVSGNTTGDIKKPSKLAVTYTKAGSFDLVLDMPLTATVDSGKMKLKKGLTLEKNEKGDYLFIEEDGKLHIKGKIAAKQSGNIPVYVYGKKFTVKIKSKIK